MLGDMTNSTKRWSVGEVAETSGLTVRTLHHWDEIGLLSPEVRGAGGRREYSDGDLGRLYVVLTLRQLGLDLESIRTCLDAGLDPRRVLADQLAHLDRALTTLGRLRERVAGVVAAGDDQVGGADPTEMLNLMRAARTDAGEVLDRHLNEEQRERLATAGAAVGPALAYRLEVEWPHLYRSAEELRLAGARPDDPRVQKIVGRMEQLSALMTTDAADAGAAVRRAWRDDPASMSGESAQIAGPWRDLAEFVEKARSLHRGKQS
jgi:DNA-binding transcriptional MerR regulator